MDGSSGTKSVPRAVSCAEIGLSNGEWEESLAAENFLSHPKTLKDIIETNLSSITAAQAFTLLFDLARHMAELDGDVSLLQHPEGPSLRARNRTSATILVQDLPTFVIDAHSILAEELSTRLFGSGYEDRPSDIRLVQIYMSKQVSVETVLAPHLVSRARTLYLAMLRKATFIRGAAAQPEDAEPTLPATPKTPTLLRSVCIAQSQSARASSAAATCSAQGDPVALEANRWASLSPDVITKHTQHNGLVHEFELVSSVEAEFPLHYTVFQQCASHIAHEGNSESTFSSAGGLSDPNMAANFLCRLTRVAGRKDSCKPDWPEVFSEYTAKYGSKQKDSHQHSIGGEYHSAEDSSADEDADAP